MILHIINLFRESLTEVSKKIGKPVLDITREEYIETCKKNKINYVNNKDLLNYGGYIYLKEVIFKQVLKNESKAKREERKKQFKEEVIQRFYDYVSENKIIPTFKEFSNGSSISVKDCYKDVDEIIKDVKKIHPDLEELVLNESIYTKEYSTEIDKIVEESSRFVITTAVVGKPINRDFYNSMLNYAERNSAKVLILPCQDTANRKGGHEWALDPTLRQLGYVLFDSKRINDNLIIWDIKTSAKQIKPTTGLSRMVQPLDSSIIIASPKQSVEYVPTKPDRCPHAIITTGAVTQADYSSEYYMSHRLSKIAEVDHKIGAIIVEKVDNKTFHFRNVEASNDNTFTDMGIEYLPNGNIRKCKQTKMVLGDAHSSLDMESLYEAIFDTARQLQVDEVILHDVFNASSISPHEVGKIALQSAKAIKGISSIEKEAKLLKEYLENISSNFNRVTITKGNHDLHLNQYLISGRFMYSPEDFYISLHLAAKLIEGEDPLKYLMETWIGLETNNIKWLGLDESHILYGTEVGYHGNMGANGSRGSKIIYDQCLGKCIIGHSHTAGILRNVMSVGIACNKDQGYNKGFSSWTYTSAVIYNNGTRQLINYIPRGDKFLYRIGG